MAWEDTEPCYVISVVARMVGVHAQTLRYYEKVGIIAPSRSLGRIRLYSQRDVDRLRQIQRLMNDLGVNLAGVEVIMHLRERMAEMEQRLREMEAEVLRLREAQA